MHYLVRLIIEAEDVEEVISQASSVMDNLVDWNEIDWYTYPDQESGWDDCWKPMKLESESGQAWVREAMDAQYDDFSRCMLSIRQMVLDYSDQEIFEEDFGEKSSNYLSRYIFSKASGYHANSCQLYDTNGSSITNRGDLSYYLKDPENLWVVQVDCHS